MVPFFLYDVEVEKSIELLVKDTDVKGENTPFMISRTDGLTSFVSPTRNGSGLSSSLKSNSLRGRFRSRSG